MECRAGNKSLVFRPIPSFGLVNPLRRPSDGYAYSRNGEVLIALRIIIKTAKPACSKDFLTKRRDWTEVL